MLTKKWLAFPVMIVAISFMSIYGCKSSTSPGTGGGGVNNLLTKGVYRMDLSIWTCGMADTMMLMQEATMCSDFALEELLELDCPVNITNGTFTLDCTSTVTDFDCTYQERLQATGTLVGTSWVIDATLTTTNEVPTGCSQDPPCQNARVVLTRVTDPPAACTYAAPNTIQATIVGGPLAGSTEFQSFGSGSGVGGIYSWNFFGQAGTFVPAQQPGIEMSNVANLTINLFDINANNLPETFEVSVVGPGAATVAASGSVAYLDQSTAGAYFYSTGGSGSITVVEVSNGYIAGTINSLTINGITSPPVGEPTADSRSMTGGFYVFNNLGPVDKATHETGWIKRLLSQ